ncbi:hypothetical protein [Actinomadura craniellae]|nr:hypothetical protein [Actinomadura craniellae]
MTPPTLNDHLRLHLVGCCPSGLVSWVCLVALWAGLSRVRSLSL